MHARTWWILGTIAGLSACSADSASPHSDAGVDTGATATSGTSSGASPSTGVVQTGGQTSTTVTPSTSASTSGVSSVPSSSAATSTSTLALSSGTTETSASGVTSVATTASSGGSGSTGSSTPSTAASSATTTTEPDSSSSTGQSTSSSTCETVEGYDILPAVLTLLDSKSGAPITDATFAYASEDGYGDAAVPEETLGASQGADGVYYIENLPEGGVGSGYYFDPYGSTFALVASAPGFVSQLISNVKAGTTDYGPCGVAYDFMPTVETIKLVPVTDAGAGCAEAGVCSSSRSSTGSSSRSSAGSTSGETGSTSGVATSGGSATTD